MRTEAEQSKSKFCFIFFLIKCGKRLFILTKEYRQFHFDYNNWISVHFPIEFNRKWIITVGHNFLSVKTLQAYLHNFIWLSVCRYNASKVNKCSAFNLNDAKTQADKLSQVCDNLLNRIEQHRDVHDGQLEKKMQMPQLGCS